MKRRVVHWEEADVHSRWRSRYFWQRGELRAVKRRTNRRERREGKRDAREQERDR